MKEPDDNPYAHLVGGDRTRGYRRDLRWRIATARHRGFPAFLVIGAQRSGTSALYELLTRHPAVLAAKRKEVHYFDLNFDAGDVWYRAHFPLYVSLLKAARRYGASVTGEASPLYLFHPDVPARVAVKLPDVQLIGIFRDPVERALSHYRHEVSEGRETLPLEEALEREESLDNPPDEAAWAFSYVRRGLYADQLRRWLPYFDRDRLLVLRSEDFFARPASVVGKVFDFLGVSSEPKLRFDRQARNSTTMSAPEISTAVRTRLSQRFSEPNKDLADLLGRSFDWQ